MHDYTHYKTDNNYLSEIPKDLRKVKASTKGLCALSKDLALQLVELTEKCRSYIIREEVRQVAIEVTDET